MHLNLLNNCSRFKKSYLYTIPTIPAQAKLSSVKHLFSKLDPAVVKSQGDAIGEIGLALRYRQDKELLMIRVVSAHGLASRQVARLSVDPQVLSLKYGSSFLYFRLLPSIWLFIDYCIRITNSRILFTKVTSFMLC